MSLEGPAVIARAISGAIVYSPDGAIACSNGELVAKARQMCEDAGRPPGTVEGARTLLGVRHPQEAAAA